MKKNLRERGQALVLIAFGIIVLIGMVGLAVDGGNAYSDRRRAQNAADTAVLAGALAYARNDSNWQGIADNRAVSNGYADADFSHSSTIPSSALPYANVEVYNCADAAPNPCPNPPGDDPTYIEVVITSNIPTYFAKVIGIPIMTNQVRAIAHVVPQEITPMYPGNALVALDPHACPGVNYSGSADTTLINGGIFVNSDCQPAYTQTNAGSRLTAPSLCTVGTYDIKNQVAPYFNVPSLQDNCAPIQSPSQAYTMPPLPDGCKDLGNATVQPNAGPGGEDIWSEGVISGSTDFPPNTNHKIIFNPGVYCITNADFQINSNYTVSGSGVTFYVENGAVDWNGGANINLTAPTSSYYSGLLLYVDQHDTNPVNVLGNVSSGTTGTSNLSGTILAPGSQITLSGSSTTTLDGQVIGDTINLTGSSGNTINFDAGGTFKPLSSPQVQLWK